VSRAAGAAGPLPASIDALQQALADEGYIAGRDLAVSVFLSLTLGRPLFLEGEAGVGKTTVASALASSLDARLIRLQCYEGLDVAQAVYEWDYARQLLEIRLLEARGAALSEAEGRRQIFSEAFLLKRPLLQAVESASAGRTILLIDEIDRADEEFEGYLLELLSEFQITVPEIGTFRAATPPIVVLTSNRTREVHDALKRRCLYQWIDYPTLETEIRILESRLPGVSRTLSEKTAAFVQELRAVELYKTPGVSETIDWTAALAALDQDGLDPAVVDETLGALLKHREDVDVVRGARAGELLARASARGVRGSGG
jgi:MoxR-like ATPase